MTAKKWINTAALTVLLLAGSAAAQTTTEATTTSPGTPNTGSGGSATANMIVLTGSAALAMAGLYALSRRRSL